MSKIQVNVEDLKSFADIIGDIEDQCDDALRHLNWDFSSFLADLPGVSPKRVKEVEEIYRNVIKKYQAKLDHAQQLVKHTEAAMRQAEKNIGDKAGEFGLEMLGYYDVQRVFGEYDPITGEKVSGADRLLATGMLALSIYPPGKAVGVTGKVAIKGANAGTKTSTKFGLSFIAKSPKVFQSLKNVVSTGKVLEVFKGVYKQVVEAPLAATKLWLDRTVRQIADFRMSVFGTQLATPMGAVPRNTGGNAFGEAKDAFVKMVKGDGDNLSNGKGNYVSEPKEVVNKGTGKEYLTRQIDSVEEAQIIDRVKELRGKLSSKYKKSGNFAVAEVDVRGINKSEFYAQSSINELKGNLEHKVPDISLQPENPMFKATKAVGKDGDSYLRNTDTEYKILNDIAANLGENTQVSGKIKLFTELDTCDSCNKVIAAFAAKYKNIELEVIHNNGNRIIP